MLLLTEEEKAYAQRIFYHLFELRLQQLPFLQDHSALCVELPISFRDYVITATFNGNKPELILGVGRHSLNKKEFSYSHYSHMLVSKDSFYRQVDGTFLSPEYTPFQLKYAPLYSKSHPQDSQHYLDCFLEFHNSYHHGAFHFYVENFPAFFSMFNNASPPKLSL